MTDRPTDRDPVVPPPTPGERRLDRPPSDRYRAAQEHGPAAANPSTEPAITPLGATEDRPSPARGVAFGALVAIVGAGALTLIGGALAVSAGLLVVAATIGYAVALVTVTGAGQTVSRSRRAGIAAILAGLGVLVGQVGLWLFARAEGGVLAPIDYLGQTFGPLVPLELLLAVAVAWWRAR